MADDLRARLAAAFEPHCWHEFASTGEVVTSIQVADALDAAMAVVEERLFRARNWDGGKCRWCRAVVSEILAKGLGKQLQPHRMTCQFYVGPVEHGNARSHESWAGLAVWHDCLCGKSWNGDEHDECPNSAESWRGPVPEQPESP